MWSSADGGLWSAAIRLSDMNKSAKKSAPKSLRIERNGQLHTLSEANAIDWLRSLNLQNPASALQQCRKALQQNPQAGRLRAYYYQCLCDQELKQELLSETESMLTKSPRDKLALSYRAHALRLVGQVEEAATLLEKLLKLSPADHIAINSLATAVKELGDFSRAEALFDRAIAIKPAYSKAYWNKSDISSTPDKDLAHISELLSSPKTPDSERHHLHFSAYRMHERLGQYKEAFTHLQQGNSIKLASLGYSTETDLRIDSGIRNYFSRELIESKRGVDRSTIAPIFIFGMPRSGTTLVEQIVASHSWVKGGNELSTLGDATREIQKRYRLSGDFPSWLNGLPDSGWRDLGDVYDALTKPLRGDKPVLSDKALLNYKTVGLIHLSLPQAKLIQVDRNPMDLCFGCYRQLFNEGLKFSYDFDHLAKIYASYQKLMAHWDEVLPGYVLRVKYEDLVGNPQEQIQSILDFCELPGQPSCFEPHKTRRTVRTLSAAQVREPISTAGVDRWQTYAEYLVPLKKALLENGIQIPD